MPTIMLLGLQTFNSIATIETFAHLSILKSIDKFRKFVFLIFSASLSIQVSKELRIKPKKKKNDTKSNVFDICNRMLNLGKGII